MDMASDLGAPTHPSSVTHKGSDPPVVPAGYYGDVGVFGRGANDQRVLSELSASVIERLSPGNPAADSPSAKDQRELRA
jgi:hypothetical protein